MHFLNFPGEFWNCDKDRNLAVIQADDTIVIISEPNSVIGIFKMWEKCLLWGSH